jgi:thioredoxin 1
MNDFLPSKTDARLVSITMLAVALVGCQGSVPSIDMPAHTTGDAEVYRFNAETGQVDHVTMAVADAVDSAGKTVVMDFAAEWCGPCKMLSPEMEQVAEKLDGQVVVVKVNIDEHPELAQHFQVSSIPDVRFFKDGKATGGFRGYRTADRIIPMLQD